MTPILAAKKKLEALGFKCAPLKLRSDYYFGQDRCWSDSDFPPDCNVGIMLDNRFVDIALVCEEAMLLGDHLLPATRCIWGRKSAQREHWFYLAPGARQAHFKTGEPLIEVRARRMLTAKLTLAPGSIHPSGEPIEFYADGRPSASAPSDLETRCQVLAAAATFAKALRSKEGLLEPASAFAALLAHAGVPLDLAMSSMKGLAELCPSVQLTELIDGVKTAYRGPRQAALTALALLRDTGLSDLDVECVEKWLPARDHGASLAGPQVQSKPVWKDRVTNVGEFLNRHIQPKAEIIAGLLRTSDAALVYGLPGDAKTLSVLEIANAVAKGGNFGALTATGKRNVLYVDGELNDADFKGLCCQLSLDASIHIVASADLQANCEEPDITDPDQQAEIINLVDALKIDLVIFDNLFALAKVEEFTSNDDPGIRSLAAFASRLRNKGVAVIFVHHATKSGKGPAGATRLSVPMDLVIAVRRDGDWVTLSFEKHRGRKKPDDIHLKIASDGTNLRLVSCDPISQIGLAHEREGKVLDKLASGVKSIRTLAAQLNLGKDVVREVLKQLAQKGDVAKASDKANSPYAITEKGKKRLPLCNTAQAGALTAGL